MTELSGFTIAVHHFDAMRAFYAAIFREEWEEVELAPGIRILRMSLAGMTIQLCAASVAGVTAADFRHQLRFTVADLQAAIATGLAHGGQLHSEPVETADMRFAALRDPDGNTLELEENR